MNYAWSHLCSYISKNWSLTKNRLNIFQKLYSKKLQKKLNEEKFNIIKKNLKSSPIKMFVTQQISEILCIIRMRFSKILNKPLIFYMFFTHIHKTVHSLIENIIIVCSRLDKKVKINEKFVFSRKSSKNCWKKIAHTVISLKSLL